jgi:hypothetical protein
VTGRLVAGAVMMVVIATRKYQSSLQLRRDLEIAREYALPITPVCVDRNCLRPCDFPSEPWLQKALKGTQPVDATPGLANAAIGVDCAARAFGLFTRDASHMSNEVRVLDPDQVRAIRALLSLLYLSCIATALIPQVLTCE